MRGVARQRTPWTGNGNRDWSPAGERPQLLPRHKGDGDADHAAHGRYKASGGKGSRDRALSSPPGDSEEPLGASNRDIRGHLGTGGCHRAIALPASKNETRGHGTEDVLRKNKESRYWGEEASAQNKEDIVAHWKNRDIRYWEQTEDGWQRKTSASTAQSSNSAAQRNCDGRDGRDLTASRQQRSLPQKTVDSKALELFAAAKNAVTTLETAFELGMLEVQERLLELEQHIHSGGSEVVKQQSSATHPEDYTDYTSVTAKVPVVVAPKADDSMWTAVAAWDDGKIQNGKTQHAWHEDSWAWEPNSDRRAQPNGREAQREPKSVQKNSNGSQRRTEARVDTKRPPKADDSWSWDTSAGQTTTTENSWDWDSSYNAWQVGASDANKEPSWERSSKHVESYSQHAANGSSQDNKKKIVKAAPGAPGTLERRKENRERERQSRGRKPQDYDDGTDQAALAESAPSLAEEPRTENSIGEWLNSPSQAAKSGDVEFAEDATQRLGPRIVAPPGLKEQHGFELEEPDESEIMSDDAVHEKLKELQQRLDEDLHDSEPSKQEPECQDDLAIDHLESLRHPPSDAKINHHEMDGLFSGVALTPLKASASNTIDALQTQDKNDEFQTKLVTTISDYNTVESSTSDWAGCQ